MVSKQRPRYQACEQLGESPEDGQDREKILMRTRQELEENGRVDGKVAPHANTPERREDGNCCEIWRSCRNETEDGGYTNSQVESPPAAKDVA